MSKKIKEYLEQNIDNPKYLFHGSPKILKNIMPRLSSDSNKNTNNIANAVFLFPSFLKATPYAFKDTIKQYSDGLDWHFNISNNNDFPLMKMENVNIEDDIIGYVYVFIKTEDMIKDKNSYQYKCFHELEPVDVVPIHFNDYKHYYVITSNHIFKK